MRTAYTDTNIQFTIEDVTFISVNIIFERFTRTIPSHSHGNNCYEIHFIPYGFGKVSGGCLLRHYPRHPIRYRSKGRARPDTAPG